MLAGLLRELVAYVGLRAWEPLDRCETSNCEGDEQERLSHEERRLSLRRCEFFERCKLLERLHHANEGVQIQRHGGRDCIDRAPNPRKIADFKGKQRDR